MSPGDYQDLREDQDADDISGEPAAPRPLLPHPANQHQNRAADVSDPEELGAHQIASITDEEAGRPRGPRQQVRLKKSKVSPEDGARGEVASLRRVVLKQDEQENPRLTARWFRDAGPVVTWFRSNELVPVLSWTWTGWSSVVNNRLH